MTPEEQIRNLEAQLKVEDDCLRMTVLSCNDWIKIAESRKDKISELEARVKSLEALLDL